jgi:peptidyl-prolyl cis-trans isomerase B (cyclophilin B)
MDKIKVVATLVSLVILSLALTGCFEEEKKTEPIEFELIGKSHKIVAGNSTTYVFIVKNNQDKNVSISLTIASKPEGWDVSLNLTSFNLSAKAYEEASIGIFLLVNASSDASTGDYKITIEAVSELDGKKKSMAITTKVIGKDENAAKRGDKVEVDYLGYHVDYKIFDTSIEEIATNTAILKVPDYTTRGGYTPLKVYVGPEDPDPADPYISSVEGFWEAIEGLSIGQSRTVVLPPIKGYGEFVNATLNLTEEVLILETMTMDEYDVAYDQRALEGIVMKHHFWGWNASIDYVNETDDIVIIRNEPKLNQSLSPYGWSSQVIYKNQSDNGGLGNILVQHNPQEGMDAFYLNQSAIVKQIVDGEIHLEYNISTHELANEVLIFDITLVDILG